jgi:endo-1,3(4)-beta-glucanase
MDIQSNVIFRGLQYDVATLVATTPPVPGDYYGWGNTMAAHARKALIADQLGLTSLRNQVISWLETTFNYWFQASTSLTGYETGWGGIVDKAGYDNSYVDYGNTYYNDHQ